MNDNAEDRPGALAASIQEDFQLLIATLSHEIDLLNDPESDVLVALWKAKFVAERGLRLSERLSFCIGNQGRRG